MTRDDLLRLQQLLDVQLFIEPPMRITRNGRTRQWTGYRMARRGDSPALLSTQDVMRLATSQFPQRTLASILRRQGRKPDATADSPCPCPSFRPAHTARASRR